MHPLTENAVLSSRRFDVVGAQALDMRQDLIWLRCDPSQTYGWLGDLCVGSDLHVASHAVDAVADFNAGRLGDNAGVNTWRLATELEKISAGFTGSCFVRQ